MARLWGALAREPIDGVVQRQRFGDDLLVTLASGQRLIGSAAKAAPFADPGETLRLTRKR